MESLNWLVNVLGSAALLLWGTRMVRTGVLRAFGGGLRRFIGKSVSNRFVAFGVGLSAATILQSATATAMLTATFAARGVLDTATGLAVMLGADLGSTIVVVLLSFNVAWLSPLLVLAGVVLFSLSASTRNRQVGRALIGLGLIILSLSLIVAASAPMRESPALKTVLSGVSGLPLLGLAIGVLLTWAAHSSVAILLLVISLVSAGALPIELGLALVAGANIGSGIIPLALYWRSAGGARRILAGNLAFRCIGATVALISLPEALPLLRSYLETQAAQIAGFHFLLNLALAVTFLPVSRLAAAVFDEIVHGAEEEAGGFAPRFLDEQQLDRPSAALGCAAREVIRLADLVESMLAGIMIVFEKDDERLVKELRRIEDDVDTLHESIKLYLAQISRRQLSAEESDRCMDLAAFNTNLEHIGDIIDKNLLETARKKIREQLAFSKEGWKELAMLHERVSEQMRLAIGLFLSEDVEQAREIVARKDEFRGIEQELELRHHERLKQGRVESIESSSLHMDIVRDLKRINAHIATVAYPVLTASGQLRPTRLVADVDTAHSA